MPVDNPFLEMNQQVSVPSQPIKPATRRTKFIGEYGGLARGRYFLVHAVATILLSIAFSLPYLGATSESSAKGLVMLYFLAHFSVTLVAFIYRLKNLGYSGHWLFYLLCPILNSFMFLRCITCPEGYADRKQLDRTGRTILTSILLFAIVALGALVIR